MTERDTPPRSGGSAKAQLLTMLGEFVLPLGGSIWTSTVVDGLGLLGVNERNARQAIARLSEQGLLTSERVGRRTQWRLTGQGDRLLRVGAERIYGFGEIGPKWNSHWLVVLASVPEEQRSKRHQLRTQLGFAGFGFIGAGIAISPHVDRESAANSILRELDLERTAIVFLAETGTLLSDDDIIRRAWDLDDLAAQYVDFIDTFDRCRPTRREDRFAALVELVHAWRRFPFADPEIPSDLLPDGWPGHKAKRLFDARHRAWSSSAEEWFVSAESRGQATS